MKEDLDNDVVITWVDGTKTRIPLWAVFVITFIIGMACCSGN